MKRIIPLTRIAVSTTLVGLFMSGAIAIAADALPQSQAKILESPSNHVIPLGFDRSIPLTIKSSAVEWKGNTFHLVKLGAIQFKLDSKTHCLKAEIQADVTMFDDVDYDISAAVFDASGKLLGTARSQCDVQRVWLGQVLTTTPTISLDFGASLDYPLASSFTLSVSKQRVQTPDEWQK